MNKQIVNVDKIYEFEVDLYRVSSRCNDWGPQLTRDYLSKNICSKIGNLTSTAVKVKITIKMMLVIMTKN